MRFADVDRISKMLSDIASLLKLGDGTGFAMRRLCRGIVLLLCPLAVACSGVDELPHSISQDSGPGPEYVVGPLDTLSIFVWRHPELSQSIPVRPDGRISIPLIEDMSATGKTSTQLASDLQEQLKKFIQDPIVTVIVTSFNGPYDRQIRVVGEAAHPQAIPYRDNMTLLDAMIAVGGLTQYAAGNRATVVRRVDAKETEYRVRLADLLQNGDVSANAPLLPGDLLIIPQSWF